MRSPEVCTACNPLHHLARPPVEGHHRSVGPPLEVGMKKQFVVPVLRDEAALAQLTLGTQVCSTCDAVGALP